MEERKSEVVEILKAAAKELANAYIRQLKMIEEYHKLKVEQKKREKAVLELLKTIEEEKAEKSE
jgi:hypothetical protein